jgi:branched-chain amino acid transport system ATP-binding protein
LSDTVPVLSARGIRKHFGALVVLDGVDFNLGTDDALGIVGPNGAGKTTLLNVLAGSLTPNDGSVFYKGQEITRASADERCRLGIGRAFQIPRPFGDMTVFENVFVGASSGAGYGRARAYQRSLEVLDICGLMDRANRRAETLGLLHRKRLELARALATNPTVVLLDEIGAGLTEDESDELIVTIKELRHHGVAIVWIEHIVRVLVQVVDRMICMEAGKVIAEGSPDEVMCHQAVVDAYLGSGLA